LKIRNGCPWVGSRHFTNEAANGGYWGSFPETRRSANDPFVVIAACGKIMAMRRIHAGSLVLVSSLLGCQSGTPSAETTQRVVEESQAQSVFGAKPNWLKFTDKPELFDRVRDQAYSYCLSGGRINMECADKQDEAVEASVLAIHVASAQAEMTNKDALGTKERWVAMNPDIAPRVTKECWSLYEEHGASDARILAVCLGNLTDYSPLIQLPVAD
jgi:hypothetical protein